jgi:hypothetical protein|nr:MAG TPA: hypothetical protein [Caudoviricetes sp.]
MKINDRFDERQIELLERIKVDVNADYDESSLEELEDIVCDAMLDNLDEKQDFTPLAEEYEKILDIIVDIENNL